MPSSELDSQWQLAGDSDHEHDSGYSDLGSDLDRASSPEPTLDALRLTSQQHGLAASSPTSADSAKVQTGPETVAGRLGVSQPLWRRSGHLGMPLWRGKTGYRPPHALQHCLALPSRPQGLKASSHRSEALVSPQRLALPASCQWRVCPADYLLSHQCVHAGDFDPCV